MSFDIEKFESLLLCSPLTVPSNSLGKAEQKGFCMIDLTKDIPFDLDSSPGIMKLQRECKSFLFENDILSNSNYHNFVLKLSDLGSVTTNREILSLYSKKVADLMKQQVPPNHMAVNHSIDIVSSVLEYLFVGSTKTSKPLQLLLAANELQIPLLVDNLIVNIQFRLKPKDLFDWLEFCCRFDFQQLIPECVNSIANCWKYKLLDLDMDAMKDLSPKTIQNIPFHKHSNFPFIAEELGKFIPMETMVLLWRNFAMEKTKR